MGLITRMVWIGLVAWITVGGGHSVSAERLAELWAGTVDPAPEIVSSGNLLGGEIEELVVASGRGVRVLAWDPTVNAYKLYAEIHGLSAEVSSLAFGNFVGDLGQLELVVGTTGSGLIRVYQLKARELHPTATVGRLWTAVQQIISVDIDGDGVREMLALSESGDVVLFQPGTEEYTEMWRDPGGSNPARHIAVGDVTGDGLPEIIVGREQGTIAVYGWSRMQPDGVLTSDAERTWALLYEGFPWGSLRSVGLADIQRTGRLDILALTDQGQLYAYGYADGNWSLRHTWEAGPLMSATGLQMLHAFPPDRPIWLGITPDGLRAWEFIGGQFINFWHAPVRPEGIFQGATGAVLTSESGGTLRQFDRVSADYLRVVVESRSYDLELPIVLEQGELWLAAQDWLRLLPVRAWLTRDGERWTGVGPGFQLFIVDAGGTTVWVNGRQRGMEPAARMVEGNLYLPVAFAERLGYKATFDEGLRTLMLTRI